MVKVAFQVTPEDAVRIAKTPGIRMGYTPFGMPPGAVKYYIGASVPWKGYTMQSLGLRPREDTAKYLDMLGTFLKQIGKGIKDKGGVHEGLRKAIEISKRAAGTYGTGIYRIAAGTPLAREVVLPAKAAKQMILQGKPVVPKEQHIPGVPAREYVRPLGAKNIYESLVARRVVAVAVGPRAPM
jgi:hypothetical protein